MGGPVSLLDVKGEDCIVLLPYPAGPSKFRSTVVKSFVYDTTSNGNNEGRSGNIEGASANIVSTSDDSDVVRVFLSTISTNSLDFNDDIIFAWKAVLQQSDDNEFYAAARSTEFNGLVEKGVFTLVHKSEASGNCIYGSRFCDLIKDEGTPSAYAKLRMVVQAFQDKLHGLLTHAPTVQRSSQRLVLAIYRVVENFVIFLRDVIQAYVQSNTTIQRPIFLKPPSIPNLPPDCLLRVNLPFYDLPEAGLHSLKTYYDHYRNYLMMSSACHDPCLLYTKGTLLEDVSKRDSKGLTCLQTDDTLNAGNPIFVEQENRLSKEFECMPAKFLTETTPLKFNGAIISCTASTTTIRQSDHINNLEKISIEEADKSSFVSQRARGAYIASTCRPDLTFGFAVCSQVVTVEKAASKRLNKYIDIAKKSPDTGFNFVALDASSLRIAVFADASFASNVDLSSQLGYVVTLMDGHNKANIVHYSSFKSKRITRSVLAAELFAVVHAFDFASTVRLAVNDIMGKDVPLTIYTDWKSLFEGMLGINSTSEKQLMIDLTMLRQAYEMKEIAEVVWIPSAQNPADAMTKDNASPALRKLMDENVVDISPRSWVELRKLDDRVGDGKVEPEECNDREESRVSD